MNYNFFIISIFSFLISCHSVKKTKKILDYIDLKNSNTTKEYISQTDTTITKIYVKQKIAKINDTIWECKFDWLTVDSLPFNTSIERYSLNNSLEFVEQFFYAADESNTKITAE